MSKFMHKLRASVSYKPKREDMKEQEDSSVPRDMEPSMEPSLEPSAATKNMKPEPRRKSDPARRPDPRINIPQHRRESSACEEHDVKDAAHVPPSVLAQHLGEPTIEHGYPHDSRTKRHSISHQERHYMWSAE